MMMTLEQRGMKRPPFDIGQEKNSHPDIQDEVFWGILAKVHAYAEPATDTLYNLYSAVRYIVDSEIPGDLVECGVHMGGSVMLIQYALIASGDLNRRVFALDTFTSFVSRSAELDIDIRTGAAAGLPDPVDYTGPSVANMTSVGYEGLNVVKGDVLKTIPIMDTKQIALLRCDTDTYETTAFELVQLYDKVSCGGVVIIDDYGYTFGCKTAVDKFVAGKKILLQRHNSYVRSWVKGAQR